MQRYSRAADVLGFVYLHPLSKCVASPAAAVSKVAGQPLEMEEVEVAPPRAHEVRIRILCTSLCHTDVTFWRLKDFPGQHPIILGHEAAGVVESVGGHVHEVAVGDTVVPVFSAQCGDCPDCLSDRSNICSGLPARPGMPRDGTTRFSFAATGEPIHNFIGVSSFTEYTVVDVARVVRIGPGVPPEKACLLSCGVSTGVGAAWKVAAVEPGSSVAVFGLGVVGLAVAQGCRMRGAKQIIGVDLNPEKWDIGKRLGITDFVNPNDIGEKAGHQGDDRRRRRLLLRVHRVDVGHGGGVPKLPEGLGEDGRARRLQRRRADEHTPARHPHGEVGRRLALRRAQAQGRHPDPGAEVPGQGAGVGRVRDARDGVPRHQRGVRAAHAGEVPQVHHLDGRGQGERRGGPR
ncbi:unnamed protein product [Triticum turgidum subsp. durum]|uniref:Alcohol dehydrogenase n=1 Tax=Triticum turgidum subsp. durum TaxID=4567 RepID=A0A9R1RJG4_TRITD|nr:unnamed protein product [Triticum turgidum subsp. durum]